jgi:hypothetical protein
MAAVQVTRTSEGFTVSRTFRSMPAAQRALDLMLSVCESAFEPVPSKLDVVLAMAEADDPAEHDGRLFTKPSDDAE